MVSTNEKWFSRTLTRIDHLGYLFLRSPFSFQNLNTQNFSLETWKPKYHLHNQNTPMKTTPSSVPSALPIQGFNKWNPTTPPTIAFTSIDILISLSLSLSGLKKYRHTPPSHFDLYFSMKLGFDTTFRLSSIFLYNIGWRSQRSVSKEWELGFFNCNPNPHRSSGEIRNELWERFSTPSLENSNSWTPTKGIPPENGIGPRRGSWTTTMLGGPIPGVGGLGDTAGRALPVDDELICGVIDSQDLKAKHMIHQHQPIWPIMFRSKIKASG
ncbi:unnamed protein product [Lactuca saligna]|uniref:Uncharacterized protein n=1 Tax=Lactuca saligna TaxID=75948 RepID=A0AA35YVQ8_LACSI|nr:unnamed protein product [Lactuca saligna]